MIFLIVILFYCIDFYGAHDFKEIVTDYVNVVNSKDFVPDYSNKIDDFHTLLYGQLCENNFNQELVQFLIEKFGALIHGSSCSFEQSVKLIKQSVLLTSQKLKKEYQKKILLYVNNDSVNQNDIFNNGISFYHEYSAYSIDPDDQLYYQIQYIKNLDIALNIKQYLILSLVDKMQSVLFDEQEKTALSNPIFTIARYYENSINSDIIDGYFQDKQLYQKRKSSATKFDQIKLIEQQKIYLMTIRYLRGFFEESFFVLFAKDPDGDCGNYCIDICYANKEEKYGAFDVRLLLLQNEDTFSIEKVDQLYPLKNEVNIKKENFKQQTKSIIIHFFNFVFYCFKMIYRCISDFYKNKNENDLHSSVSSAQYEKIALQIKDFKSSYNDKEFFKSFLSSLYTNKDYSADYSPAWFKYWHLKEALIADLLGVKIQTFAGLGKDFDEITQTEPCYDDQSREVYVWTDNKAGHDSELVPYYCYGLMAKALRFENRYFGLDYKNQDYLFNLQEKIHEYKKNWIRDF